MYRTRVLNLLTKEFLNPILDFGGITFNEKTKCGLLRYIDVDSKGNIVYVKESNLEDAKHLAYIRNEVEFAQYRANKETIEYFNPFIKPKNALLLLMLSTPAIYSSYCVDEDSDEDYIDGLVNENMGISQMEILKYINIKQFPLTIDRETQSIYYTYELSVKSKNGDEFSIQSKDSNKSVAIIMLLIMLISKIDMVPPIVEEYADDYSRVKERLSDLLIKYDRERNANRKDAVREAKLNKEDDTDYTGTDGANKDSIDSEECFSPSVEEITTESLMEEDSDSVTKTTDITDMVKSILISPKDSDDDFGDISFA